MRPPQPHAADVGFRCDFCGRVFRTMGELDQHRLVAHAGRPYAPRCEVCQRSFESPADLKSHNQVVHGAPPG